MIEGKIGRSGSRIRPCRACGRDIEFILGPNGKTIPLQRVKTVYAVGPTGDATRVGPTEESFTYYVSHFETCSDPGRFSRK